MQKLGGTILHEPNARIGKEGSLDHWSFPSQRLDKLTLDKIIGAMTAADAPLTAEQTAKRDGVSRSTAGRYLEHLVAENKLRADLSYRDVGRLERV
ncbi:response regulator of citrate/malate metabolism [Paenibacillus sp. PvR052]|uniref:hypothetical protein n=1 Tax=unclassified Paenibacillus TaxID=185978 RepID=UPI001B617C1C|nr:MULTISPECIES: hypothetical protein [unclassified Paenibacillus]MBP1155641.1 response regulator of citrate/malate metabolism [Paenibacillus sp. PvP091]MBP1168973.1 response regulator of citrate/malate metabolism [Paenibacillus sp. PvR098]MBP2440001.1 response regulator of citrate/malate metabolism [Paenibacillus sp. PvP052]